MISKQTADEAARQKKTTNHGKPMFTCAPPVLPLVGWGGAPNLSPGPKGQLNCSTSSDWKKRAAAVGGQLTPNSFKIASTSAASAHHVNANASAVLMLVQPGRIPMQLQALDQVGCSRSFPNSLSALSLLIDLRDLMDWSD